jgi:hypothetical protein
MQEEDDFMLRRFLRARDHNIGRASVMLLQYLSWKRDIKPRSYVSDDEVRNEIAKGRIQLHGFDRLGRPMGYLYSARHFPARHDLDDFKRYCAYVLDKICSRYIYIEPSVACMIRDGASRGRAGAMATLMLNF